MSSQGSGAHGLQSSNGFDAACNATGAVVENVKNVWQLDSPVTELVLVTVTLPVIVAVTPRSLQEHPPYVGEPAGPGNCGLALPSIFSQKAAADSSPSRYWLKNAMAVVDRNS